MKLILPEQITEAQYKAYLADWGAERIVPIARSIGIKKVLITCNDTNTGSAKTIESAGGVLENKVLEEGILTRRYWVPCADDFERKK